MAEKLQRWSARSCGCSFNLAVDTDTGAIRYVTRDEAVALHQQLYDAEPWRVRLFNPATGERTTHNGLPEDDPQVATLLAAGWVYLHTVEPGFPRRFKNIIDPAKAPQPIPEVDAPHSGQGHTVARYNAVINEGRRLDRVQELLGTRLNRAVGISEFEWLFTAATLPVPGARILQVALPFPNADKTFVRSALNLEFGTGHVVVL